jgi:hypothetical protein
LAKFRIIFAIIVFALCLTGCIPANSQTTILQPTMTTVFLAASQTLPPTDTPNLLPTPTTRPQPTKTSTPFSPIKGTINVENFKLRSGPGFLFDTINLYDQNEVVEVYGRTQGSGWYFVSTSDSRSGWMKSEYITLFEDESHIPFYGFNDGDLIFGHVKNSAGKPMTHIGIVIFPAVSEDSSLQDNAVTDDSGTFYLYLPKNL